MPNNTQRKISLGTYKMVLIVGIACLNVSSAWAQTSTTAAAPPWATGTPSPSPNPNPGSGSQPGLAPQPGQMAGPSGPPGSATNPVAGGALLAMPQGMGVGAPTNNFNNRSAGTVGNNLGQNGSAAPQVPTPPLGLMQQAWDSPDSHLGAGQEAPGLKTVYWTPGSTNVVNTREDMLTNIVFPPGETVTDRLLSDSGSYEAVIAPDHHSVSIRPIFIGVDADLNIYGASGNLYVFYLRSEPWDSPQIADMNVAVSVPNMGSILGSPTGGVSGTDGSNSTQGDPSPNADGAANPAAVTGLPGDQTNNGVDGSSYDDDSSARLTLQPRALATRVGVDYSAHALTGNGRIRNDLTIMAPNPADAVIAPVAAWRDDNFTYLDFGPRAASMNEWPVAALVVDNTESPVGTRVAGPNRSIMVVEGIGNITLRDGDHIVCIKIALQNGDTRSPVIDEPYQNDRSQYSTPTNIEHNTTPPLGVTGPGAGDYTGDIQGSSKQPTWPNIAGIQTAAPFKIETGPFTVATASLLADQIGRGYHNNQPAGAVVTTTPPSQVGPTAYPYGIDGATAMVDITAASPVLATKLCQTLQRFDHTCRLY